jgi:hypothetical protein
MCYKTKNLYQCMHHLRTYNRKTTGILMGFSLIVRGSLVLVLVQTEVIILHGGGAVTKKVTQVAEFL